MNSLDEKLAVAATLGYMIHLSSPPPHPPIKRPGRWGGQISFFYMCVYGRPTIRQAYIYQLYDACGPRSACPIRPLAHLFYCCFAVPYCT